MAVPVIEPASETRDGTRPRGYVKEILGTDAAIFVGTSSLVRPEHHRLNLSSIARLCEVVKDLRAEGHHVIVVTSGAVGIGCQHLSLPGPAPLKKRALAAVGQVQLIKYYEDFLGALDVKCAQVLLTLDNLANRSQYLNARTTFTELLGYGVVPIVNENDTVAVQELRFGDNDTLSAQVAALVQADWLFLLTDVDCLYTANPKDDPTAEPIYEVEDISHLHADTSTRGSQWGTGGMATKLTAGRIATAAGCTMVICNSTTPENIVRIARGEPKLGTKFFPLPHCLKGRKRWILSVPVRGHIVLTEAAVRAVRDRRRPVLADGIEHAVGDFHLQECVALMDKTGCEFARGLVNIASQELSALLGGSAGPSRSSSEADRCVHDAHDDFLPVDSGLEVVVHRSNLVLLSASEDAVGLEGQAHVKPQMQVSQAMGKPPTGHKTTSSCCNGRGNADDCCRRAAKAVVRVDVHASAAVTHVPANAGAI